MADDALRRGEGQPAAFERAPFADAIEVRAERRPALVVGEDEREVRALGAAGLGRSGGCHRRVTSGEPPARAESVDSSASPLAFLAPGRAFFDLDRSKEGRHLGIGWSKLGVGY